MKQSIPTFQQQHQQPPPPQQKYQARPGAPQFKQQAFYKAIPEGPNPNATYAQFNFKQRPLQHPPQNQPFKMQQQPAYAQMVSNGVAGPAYLPQPPFYNPQSKYPPQVRFMQGNPKGNPSVPQAIAQNNHGIIQNNFQGNRPISPQYHHQQAQFQSKKQNPAMLMKFPPSK